MDVCVLASVYIFSCAFCVNLQIFIKGSFHVKNNICMQNTGPYPYHSKLAWLTVAPQPRSDMTLVTALCMSVNFKS